MSGSRPRAVVTGAGTGIGAAIASRLAPDHDLLLAHLHDNADIAAVAERATRMGVSVATVTGDLTDPGTMPSSRGHLSPRPSQIRT